MSALGALNFALLASVTADRLVARMSPLRGHLAALLAAVGATAVGLAVVGSLLRARDYAAEQAAQQAPRREVAMLTAAHLERSGTRRPLFRLNETSWIQAAGVVLHAGRSHPNLAVDDAWVRVFGPTFAPDGTEDMVLVIGGGCPAGRPVVAQADGLCVFEVDPRLDQASGAPPIGRRTTTAASPPR